MRVTDNILLEGSSGRADDRVYFQRYGNTYSRKAPAYSYNKVPTPKQAIMRELFKEAHRFAQSAINDPVQKKLYEDLAKGKCSAYSKAVSEYIRDHKPAHTADRQNCSLCTYYVH